MLKRYSILKKNFNVSNRYIGRHRCTIPIHRIEKNIMFFSKWTPLLRTFQIALIHKTFPAAAYDFLDGLWLKLDTYLI